MSRRALAALLVPLALLTVTLVACGDDDPKAASNNGAANNGDTNNGDTNNGTNNGDLDAGNNGADDTGGNNGAEDTSADAEPDVPTGPWADLLSAGPWHVGFRTSSVTYRPDGYDADRTLRVVTWYPTADTTGTQSFYGGLIARPQAFSNATVGLDAPAPLMIFSHGNGGFAEQSYFLAEYMASHGWVVVAFDHSGNTYADNPPFPGGSLYFDLRPQDVSAALDATLALPQADALYGMIGDDIVMAGHSFGGYTTLAVAGATYDVDGMLAACEGQTEAFCTVLDQSRERWRAGYRDDRIDVAIPMTPAGALVFAEGLADLPIPTFLMTATLDATLPEVNEGDPIWSYMDGPDERRLVLATAGHYTYSDACAILAALGENDGCGDIFIDPAEAHQVINALVMAFARRHLYGESRFDPLLDGTESLHEGAAVLKH